MAGVASHIPLIKAILVLDQREGKRVAAKYYDKKKFKNLEGEAAFEAALHKKTKTVARTETNLCLLDDTCVAYRSSQTGDVLFYVVGGDDENELILVHVLEGLFTAISSLLKYQVEKLVLVDQIALLLLVIDELVDNGYVMAAACLGAAQQPTPAVAIVWAGSHSIILETDPSMIESRVLMKVCRSYRARWGAI